MVNQRNDIDMVLDVWKKILKCREVAKKLYRVEVKNGKRLRSGMTLGHLWDV